MWRSLTLIVRDLTVLDAQQQPRVVAYPAEGYRSPKALLPRIRVRTFGLPGVEELKQVEACAVTHLDEPEQVTMRDEEVSSGAISGELVPLRIAVVLVLKRASVGGRLDFVALEIEPALSRHAAVADQDRRE